MTDLINKPSGRKLIQSVVRGTDILKLFLKGKKILGITDISKELNLPKTTIQGIVLTLFEKDFLEKDPLTGKYRLGSMLFQLGMKYATSMDLVSIARVWMERLCFKFNESVNIGMFVGGNVVIVLRIEPESKFVSYPTVGSTIPLHSTCIGKILLAYARPTIRDKFLQECSFEKLTSNTINNIDKLSKVIEEAKLTGISFDNEESIIGLSGIGSVVFNHTGRAIAGFVVTGTTDNINSKKNDIINDIKYTSAEVSRQLGYTEDKIDVS